MLLIRTLPDFNQFCMDFDKRFPIFCFYFTGIRLNLKFIKNPNQMTIQSGRRIGTILLVFKKYPLSFILCVSCGRPYFCISTHRRYACPIEKRIGVASHQKNIHKSVRIESNKPKGRSPLKFDY